MPGSLSSGNGNSLVPRQAPPAVAGVSQLRKINLNGQWRPAEHRSGWGYAMDSLRCLHHERGVLLDGFVEKKFAWGVDRGDRWNDPQPHRKPWIGILHNPPNIPERFNLSGHAPLSIFQVERWRQSLPYCRGLFTLSAYLKRWLQPHVPVQVCSLLHPTEIPANQFTRAKYLSNGERKIVQVGWWLRNFYSFYELCVTKLEKVLLEVGQPWSTQIREAQLQCLDGNPGLASVRIVPYLPNEQYDEVLSKNIVFLDLYDSSANNAIVECIARATPVLVNPLPAVIEYLGPDYPLYFNSLEEAAFKAENEDLVLTTHEYLKGCSARKKITREYFLESFVESEIYRSLPSPFFERRQLFAPRQINGGSLTGCGVSTMRQPGVAAGAGEARSRSAVSGGTREVPRVSIIGCVVAADSQITSFMRDITRQTVFDQSELILLDVPSSHHDAAGVERVISKYRMQFYNISYQKLSINPGRYHAWNTAIGISRGEYITNANLGDRRAPDSLEQHLGDLEIHPEIDVVCAAVLATNQPNETWESNTAFRTYCKAFNWQSWGSSSLGSCEEFGLNDLFLKDESGRWIDSDNLPHSMPMWRRSLHRRFGYFDEQTYGPVADWEFWIRCAAGGAKFRLLGKTLGLYLENAHSYDRRTPTTELKRKVIETYWPKHYGYEVHPILAGEMR